MAKMRRINLALQGGGAHGAFTWGVLDRFLQEPGLEIAGISGTSAGALNGAALKSGLVAGGAEAARENLAWLWAQVGAVNDPRLLQWMAPQQAGLERFNSLLGPFAPQAVAEAIGRVFSPYDYGVFYANPLQDIAERFRYDDVCHSAGPALHIAATNVRSGKIRVFSNADISAKVILASACLPTLFQAIEIPDAKTGRLEAYWDGGYTGNPALFPLFDPKLPNDIVIVNINPLERDSLPRTAQDIQNRINEISFNSSLLRELRAIQFVKTLIADGHIDPGKMKDVFVHMVADDALMNRLTAATKAYAGPTLLAELKAAGQDAAEGFLSAHSDDLNKRGSVDLRAMFS
ncbi:patatin-like phospholipase family protein [Abyssibius alkaniclasticus]|uniref:patatin-like phospholipase family protein n=1 Tax=Abyssibius alkaniclasticus TaxID=2881234 RepID=UPI00236323D2|nr:patatin-like phospholipase family protein [Abyssibius alkaniclasticus]UPH70722.1 patatin-like phospholipase family protein [Abyssibius alkaniclasticus]